MAKRDNIVNLHQFWGEYTVAQCPVCGCLDWKILTSGLELTHDTLKGFECTACAFQVDFGSAIEHVRVEVNGKTT